MKYTVSQILGVAIFILGLQGAIRLIDNASDPGLLAWVPGGADLKIGLYVSITIAGGALASWAYKRSRARSK